MSWRTQTPKATLGQALPLGHSAPSPMLISQGRRGWGWGCWRQGDSCLCLAALAPHCLLPADFPWPPTRPLGVPVPDVLDLPGEPPPLKPARPSAASAGFSQDLRRNETRGGRPGRSQATGPADPEGVAQGTAPPPQPLCSAGGLILPRPTGGRRETAPLALVPPPPRPSRAGLCVGSSGPSLWDNWESPRATAPGVCMTLE